jgi:hypothetical protein
MPLLAFGNKTYKLNFKNSNYKYSNYTKNSNYKYSNYTRTSDFPNYNRLPNLPIIEEAQIQIYVYLYAYLFIYAFIPSFLPQDTLDITQYFFSVALLCQVVGHLRI